MPCADVDMRGRRFRWDCVMKSVVLGAGGNIVFGMTLRRWIRVAASEVEGTFPVVPWCTLSMAGGRVLSIAGLDPHELPPLSHEVLTFGFEF